ncbi:hypothetical protein [Lentzea sp. E54]|uniref:hypothetical protein n=1 Tax=Lentzea xerophila TaxID=3435883 RepID=UPI003DA578E9
MAGPAWRGLRGGACAAGPARRGLRGGACAAGPARRDLRGGACAAGPARRDLRGGTCAAGPARRDLRGWAPRHGAELVPAANLCLAMTMATLVLFAQQRLGLAAAGFGVLLATLACGGIAGALLAERILARTRHAFAAVNSFCAAVWGGDVAPQAAGRAGGAARPRQQRADAGHLRCSAGRRAAGWLTADHFGLLAPWYAALALRTTSA